MKGGNWILNQSPIPKARNKDTTFLQTHLPFGNIIFLFVMFPKYVQDFYIFNFPHQGMKFLLLESQRYHF